MKNILWATLVAFLLSGACAAQSLPPVELMQAMHCITTNNKGWLTPPLAQRKEWPASAAHDRMGYPHEDRIIVAVYETPTRGQLFDLTIRPSSSKRLFHIQNSGTFNLEKGRITFVNEPSGDQWARGRPETWAREAMREQHFMVRATALRAMGTQVSCTSYLREDHLKEK
jgi:hypothetical protein